MPSFFDVTWGKLQAAVKAFREHHIVVDPFDPADWDDFEGRRMRYALLFAMYENTIWRSSVHSFVRKMMVDFSMYRYIRSIYTPAYRLGEFYISHLMGGMLDPGAGPEETSALPIIPAGSVDGDALAQVIAMIWRRSNWQVRKDIFTMYGATMGDVGLRVVDDPEKETTYLEPVHPGTIRAVDFDPFGNVKAYVLQEQRPDPLAKVSDDRRLVTYTEICERGEDGSVNYRTERDGVAFDWTGNDEGGEWSTDYGFVPFCLVKHRDVGLDWGWAEVHPLRSKAHEVDDLASKLNDQIRKMVDGPWLFTGMRKPATQPQTTSDEQGTRSSTEVLNRPHPGREKMPIFYAANPQAGATPLVTNLNIGAVGDELDRLIAEIERDFPELQVDSAALQGKELSGRALRTMRQPASTKVQQRRVGYDDCLVRAHQMAISIGAQNSYPGFEDFKGDDEAFEQESGHVIGKRPVFAKDPHDDFDLHLAQYQAIQAGMAAGLPIELVAEREGLTEEEIKQILQSEQHQARLKGFEAAVKMADAAGSPPQGNGKEEDEETEEERRRREEEEDK
jgi:hypothetical protein